MQKEKYAWALPVTLSTAVTILLLSAFRMLTPVSAVAEERYELPVALVATTDDIPEFNVDTISDDVLWLARCIYSETKRANEQELVAWVVRNRVETEYRGQSSYRGVILDPYQFSAFNRGSRKRRFYMSLSPYANARGWLRTMKVAHDVYYSDASDRPFPITTRHFYSEQSMRGRRAPTWSRGERPVRPTRYRIDERRFRFYSGIS